MNLIFLSSVKQGKKCCTKKLFTVILQYFKCRIPWKNRAFGLCSSSSVFSKTQRFGNRSSFRNVVFLIKQWTMDKVQKHVSFKCNTPSLERTL
jgi:hypothetical protein